MNTKELEKRASVILQKHGKTLPKEWRGTADVKRELERIVPRGRSVRIQIGFALYKTGNYREEVDLFYRDELEHPATIAEALQRLETIFQTKETKVEVECGTGRSEQGLKPR